MKERNGARLSAVLPADTQLYLRANSSPILNSHPYESTHPLGVKHLEWIVCKNTPINVRGKEPARIVATEPQCSLRQIICSK
jgi:hypothetical protein